MTTVRRQSITGLRPIMAEVLKHYLADFPFPVEKALAMEKDLAGAAYDYFYPTEEAPRRYDFLADPQMHARVAMIQRIEDSLRINTDDTPEWERVISHCIAHDAKGETVEKYALWCGSDEGKYNAPKPHQMSLKPAVIIGTWRQAFPKQANAPQAEPEADGGYRI